MDRKETLNNYYARWAEDDRLLTSFGKVEFAITLKYVEKYLKPGMKILEIGAGTGRYTHCFAKRGYEVDAVELVQTNLDILNGKTVEGEKIHAYIGDAVDLHFLKNDTYDITLLLGPMYHLEKETERKAALAEAVRVTKKGGLVYSAYILNECAVFSYFFMSHNILDEAARAKIMDSKWVLKKNEKKYICYYRIEDVNRLMEGFDVTRLHLVGTEMISGAVSDVLDTLTDEELEYYIRFVETICERPDMIGMAGHLLDIFEKK